MQSLDRVAKSFALAASAALWTLTLGCPGAPEPTYPVEGTVTLDGQPLEFGSLVFQSEARAGSEERYSARGVINSDGTYELTTFNPGDGAVAGKHQVAVMAMSRTTSADDPNPPPVIPPGYASPSTSGLMYEVSEGPNKINIELSSAGPSASSP